MLITSLVNVRYLTGFTGSNALLLLTANSARLFTDPRYTTQAAAESSTAISIVKKGPLIHDAISRIKRLKLRQLGFEKSHISYETHAKLAEDLGTAVNLTPLDGWVEEARLVKSAGEIERIQESVVTNSLAFDRALRKLRPTRMTRIPRYLPGLQRAANTGPATYR